MQLTRVALKQLSIWGPVAFILLLVIFFLSHHPHSPSVWITYLLVAGGLGLTGAYLFSYFVFSHIQRQEEEIVRQGEAMAAINTIGTEITGILELNGVLRSVVERARQLLDTEVSALCLVGEKDSLVPKAISGPQEAFGEGVNRLDHHGWETSCLTELSLSFDHGERLLRCSGIKEEYTKAYLAAPLRREGKVIGALCVADRSPRRFSPLEVELLKGLATQAAIAIENARLHEQLRNIAVIEERHWIAREMHDGLAQDLGYLNMKCKCVEQMLASNQVADAMAELKKINKVVRDAYEEVRQSILGLRTMVSRSLGLVPNLVEYLRCFEDWTGIAIELKITDERATWLSPHLEIQLIRIIQEALANIRKHAQARRAWVIFQTERGEAKVTVQDDGRGFDVEEATRPGRGFFGIQTMRERAESVGGTFKVESQQGKGTQVFVRFPIEGQEAASWRP